MGRPSVAVLAVAVAVRAGTFGDAGNTVVIEEMLTGPECSLLAFTDGKTVRPMATSQDSIAVQGYLQSREAMLRLEDDVGFRSYFQAADMDPIQRLEDGASLEEAYKLYRRYVLISYDPTEGIVKMEVIAPDPAVSAGWSRKLISYAEEQVDHLTQRKRNDSMQGARESYESAEKAVIEAQRKVIELQEKFKVLNSEVEIGLLTSQIGTLETQLTQERLSLAQMEANESPNQARMEPCLLYTSPSPRDGLLSRMPSSA